MTKRSKKRGVSDTIGLAPRCYLCGNPVGTVFYLMSMNDKPDRLFTICTEDCLKRIDSECYVLRVGRVL